MKNRILKAVIFESSDVIMVSEEDWVENDENSWEESTEGWK